MRRHHVLAVALFVNVMVIAVAPLLQPWTPELGAAVYNGYASLCHQIEARSFAFRGHALPLCARCTGLWLGAFLLAALTRLQRLGSSRGILLVGIALLDWSLAQLTLAPDFAVERFLTGVVGGIGIGILARSLWRHCHRRLRFLEQMLSSRGWRRRATRAGLSPRYVSRRAASSFDDGYPHIEEEVRGSLPRLSSFGLRFRF